jgi:hypothetical protein
VVWVLAYPLRAIYLFFEPARVDLKLRTYAALVTGVPLCAAQPVFAVASVLLPR